MTLIAIAWTCILPLCLGRHVPSSDRVVDDAYALDARLTQRLRSLLLATPAGVVPNSRSQPLTSGFESGSLLVSKIAKTQDVGAAKNFSAFDYRHQWYPVAWAVDVPENTPVKVTVFDTDYVIAKTPTDSPSSRRSHKKKGASAGDFDYEIIAMEDRCPHKSASLSEGRITSGGSFQCAYHGWSFDGKSGRCVQIPQVVASARKTTVSIEDTHFSGKSNPAPSMSRTRACGAAVPALIQQGMVWLFPFGQIEESLIATPPPRIPEMDMEGFISTGVVRDFPIDYSVLLENIMDPDHGLFAHGNQGFDLYSATKDYPQTVEEEFPDDGLGGKGWKVTSRVAAVEKLTSWNTDHRAAEKSAKQSKKAAHENNSIRIGTTSFHAPTMVTIGRRNPSDDNSTAFLTCFWVSPVGTGRSRFMSAAVSKAPFGVPRWVLHSVLNNFLDQDTHLLAGQQVHVLDREAEQVKELIASKELKAEESEKISPRITTEVRKSLYVYASPAERLSARVGRFWDATLLRAPRRVSTLLEMDWSGAIRRTPDRREVLDRWVQHTKICPDSLAAVANLEKIRTAGFALAMVVLALKTWAFSTVVAQLIGGLRLGRLAKLALAVNSAFTPARVFVGAAAAALVGLLAKKLEKEFHFKYDESFRDRDLENIPKKWADL